MIQWNVTQLPLKVHTIHRGQTKDKRGILDGESFNADMVTFDFAFVNSLITCCDYFQACRILANGFVHERCYVDWGVE